MTCSSRRRCSAPAPGCSSASRCAPSPGAGAIRPPGVFAIGVCGSAAIYVLTFFAVGVASDFRYGYWAVLAGIAGAVALRDPSARLTPADRHAGMNCALVSCVKRPPNLIELVERTDLHDPPGLEHQDARRLADGGEPMGDDEGGAVLHDFVERHQHFGFGRGIERAGRLVENQDRRVLQQRARNRQALALATRQRAPALAHFGVKTFDVVFDEIERLRPRGGRAHLRRRWRRVCRRADFPQSSD